MLTAMRAAENLRDIGTGATAACTHSCIRFLHEPQTGRILTFDVEQPLPKKHLLDGGWFEVEQDHTQKRLKIVNTVLYHKLPHTKEVTALLHQSANLFNHEVSLAQAEPLLSRLITMTTSEDTLLIPHHPAIRSLNKQSVLIDGVTTRLGNSSSNDLEIRQAQLPLTIGFLRRAASGEFITNTGWELYVEHLPGMLLQHQGSAIPLNYRNHSTVPLHAYDTVTIGTLRFTVSP